MSLIPKPEITQEDIWAADAEAIEKVRPVQTKIDLGWVYAEKPLHSALNWALALITSFVAYLNQVGMPEWDAATEYFEHSLVKVGPVIYVATAGSINKEPTTNPSEWHSYQPVSSILTLTPDSSTPSVSGGLSFKTANTTATEITGLTGGVAGQSITISITDVYVTIGAALSATGLARKVASGDLLVLTYDGTSWAESGNVIGQGILTINSATPSVLNCEAFETANTSLTTITGFTGGRKGQRISIFVNDAFSVIDGSMTKTGMTIPLLVNDILEFRYNGVSWIQVGGTVGMGRWVPLFNKALGVIAYEYPSYQNVDLTGEDVREGAASVVGQFEFSLHNSETSDLFTLLSCRLSPGTDASFYIWMELLAASGNIVSPPCTIMLTNDASFTLDFSTSDTFLFGTRTLNIFGYYI